MSVFGSNCYNRVFNQVMPFSLFALIFAASPLYAQSSGPKKTATKPVAVKKMKPAPAAWAGNTTREFTMDGKSFSEKGNTMTIMGTAVITSLETKFMSEGVVFDRAAQVATSEAKLQFDDVQHTLTADSGMADYKSQKATLQGNVQLVVRTQPDGSAPAVSAGEGGEAATPAPAVGGATQLGTLTAGEIVYNWKDRTGEVSGGVKLIMPGRTITADRAIYKGREETLTLEGNVVVTNEEGALKGRTAKSDKAVFQVRAEKIMMEGNVSITNDKSDSMMANKGFIALKVGEEEVRLEEGAKTKLTITDGGAATP